MPFAPRRSRPTVPSDTLPRPRRFGAALALPALLLAVACTAGPRPPGGPLDWGARALGIGPQGGGTARGAVEVIVKSEFPSILAEIEAGGGPVLTRALDAAGVPPQDRPARLLQLRADLPLYQANPGALVTALMLYGA